MMVPPSLLELNICCESIFDAIVDGGSGWSTCSLEIRGLVTLQKNDSVLCWTYVSS